MRAESLCTGVASVVLAAVLVTSSLIGTRMLLRPPPAPDTPVETAAPAFASLDVAHLLDDERPQGARGQVSPSAGAAADAIPSPDASGGQRASTTSDTVDAGNPRPASGGAGENDDDSPPAEPGIRASDDPSPPSEPPAAPRQGERRLVDQTEDDRRIRALSDSSDRRRWIVAPHASGTTAPSAVPADRTASPTAEPTSTPTTAGRAADPSPAPRDAGSTWPPRCPAPRLAQERPADATTHDPTPAAGARTVEAAPEPGPTASAQDGVETSPTPAPADRRKPAASTPRPADGDPQPTPEPTRSSQRRPEPAPEPRPEPADERVEQTARSTPSTSPAPPAATPSDAPQAEPPAPPKPPPSATPDAKGGAASNRGGRPAAQSPPASPPGAAAQQPDGRGHGDGPAEASGS